MKDLNRQAIVVQPGRPMVEWLQQIDRDLGVEPISAADVTESRNVYLIPDFDYEKEAEEYFRQKCERIFSEELAQWITEPKLWPKQRDWKTFNAWCDWELIDMVFDLVDGPIVGEYLGEIVIESTDGEDEGDGE